MFIKKIVNYDDFSEEASLIVSDGKNELLCYCSSFDGNGRTIKITSFLCDSIIKNNSQICDYHKLLNYYSYSLQARVVDVERRMVSVGNILIELDCDLPGDIKNGEYVSFNVMRLDCSLM